MLAPDYRNNQSFTVPDFDTDDFVMVSSEEADAKHVSEVASFQATVSDMQYGFFNILIAHLPSHGLSTRCKDILNCPNLIAFGTQHSKTFPVDLELVKLNQHTENKTYQKALYNIENLANLLIWSVKITRGTYTESEVVDLYAKQTMRVVTLDLDPSQKYDMAVLEPLRQSELKKAAIAVKEMLPLTKFVDYEDILEEIENLASLLGS